MVSVWPNIGLRFKTVLADAYAVFEKLLQKGGD